MTVARHCCTALTGPAIRLTHPRRSGAALCACALSVPLLVAQVLPPNVYVQQRIGSILSRGMILKSDQFPSENLRQGLDLHVIGAPNFQQIRPFALYSTGQPSVSGSADTAARCGSG